MDNPSVEDGNIITSPHYKYNGEYEASNFKIKVIILCQSF